MPTRFAHTNIAARDWRRLADFYQKVFACVPVPPERDLSGAWLDRAIAVPGARLRGIHLRLPGWGDTGPTLEIFHYDTMTARPEVAANTPGLTHIAFAVDDVAATALAVLENGGSAVGELIRRDVDGVGRLTFQYLKDPEGNIVEVQHWGLAAP